MFKGKNVLEIGCGGAQCGIAMAKKGAKVTGIDISPEVLESGKAKTLDALSLPSARRATLRISAGGKNATDNS